MKRKIYVLPMAVIVLSVGFVLIWRCTKPTKDLVINISSNIIKYKTTLHFTDAANAGTVPQGLTVRLGGPDSALIYDYSGTRELKLSREGYLTLGVDPNVNLANRELSFFVTATAPGYIPVTIPQKINMVLPNQNFPASMVSVSAPPPGIKVEQPAITISGSTIATPIQVETSTDANTRVAAGITVPTGTQLRDINNTPVNGNRAVVTVAAYDPTVAAAMISLPGGQIQTNVSGGQSEVFLLPAGFASIHMNVGNIAVKNFSEPATVQIELNNTLTNPETGATVKAGDNVNVYSFREETGQWYYENAVQVINRGGKLIADFKTNHLTTFAACLPANVRPCTNNPYIIFNAPDVDNTSSDPYIVDVFAPGTSRAPVFSEYTTVHNGDTLYLTSVPTGSLNIRISKVDYDHYLLSDYENRGATVANTTIDVCGGATRAIDVSIPSATFLKGTGYAVCPNDNSKRYLPPNGAQIYYRRSGTNDPVRLLGFIVENAVTTSLLTLGSRYDIQGNYGGQMVGGTNVLIRPDVSFLDSVHVIQSGNSSFCP